jgi:hypothetical protein
MLGTFKFLSWTQFNQMLRDSGCSNLITWLKGLQQDGYLFAMTEIKDFHEVNQGSSSKASYLLIMIF